MERFRISETNVREVAERAAIAVQAGGVVLYPTDTLYGLGADAFSDSAVDRVYAIKGRDEGKPMHAIVADIAMAERFAEISDDARIILNKLPKGKVTVVAKKKAGLEQGICRRIDTFGFRIPDSEFCMAFLEAFGGPVTATSANASGMQPQMHVDAILEQLDAGAELLGLVADTGTLPAAWPSTVVDCSGGAPVILREAAIPAADIWNALKSEY